MALVSALSKVHPVDVIRLFAGNAIPAGWLKCDGSQVLISDYPELYQLIGQTYAEGQTPTVGYFFLPKANGRVMIAKSATYPIAAYGGVNNVILSLAQMATHDHGVSGSSVGSMAHSHPTGNTNIGGSHAHDLNAYSGAAGALDGVGNFTNNGNPDSTENALLLSAGSHTHAGSTNAASMDHTHQTAMEGGSQAHENRQPYVAMQWCVKAA